ncbi:MAG: MotA/TolQ/ExbB proton channel family protein [Planctomycetota bacterium]
MAGIFQTATDLFERGGWVMFPLTALALVSVCLSVERTLFFIAQHGPGSGRRIAGLVEALREAPLERARARAAEDRTLYGRLVSLLLSKEPKPPATSGPLAQALAERARRPFERFAAAHGAIIAAAPMLGILGTVTGIIDSFGLIGADETIADPSLVAAGISEALFTTAFGLTVALITLFPYAIFRVQTERALDRIELIGATAVARAEPTTAGS